MVDEKITDYTALTGANVATGDLFEIVDVSDTTMDATGTNKKVTADELRKAMGALGETSTDAIWDAKGDLAVGTAADTASKLTVGANGTLLTPDSTQTTGLKWVTGRAYVVDEAHADAGSASSVAEQTLASLTLPAGVVAAGDALRCMFSGDRLNNSGGAVTYQWKFKIGGTTLHNTSTLTMATGPSRTGWSVVVDVAFAATNAERAVLQLLAGVSSSTPQITAGQSAVMYGTATEDTSSALTVALTCQLGTSNASTDVILHAASMVLVKK